METLQKLYNEVEDTLVSNILPYWMNRLTDNDRGGFFGRITGEEVLVPDAPKGVVLCARILWTFSAAYRLLGKEEYLAAANRAKRYFIDHFYDPDYGGVYWSLTAEGKPLDTKKQIYALGFAIYGLSEHYRATADEESLAFAIALFEAIEEHSFDPVKNGYCEALTREWAEIADMRLSEKDANERKTMNTHLHILEPYTNLLRVWKNDRLRDRLSNLILLFTGEMFDKQTGHLKLFFDNNWQSKSSVVSYGHDIEASWLLHEAALVLDDPTMLSYVWPFVRKIADAATEGFTPEGGMVYEYDPVTRHSDADRHWWVQAETVVGYFNLYEHFGNFQALNRALACWQFIQNRLVDRVNGEWFWSIRADETVNRDDDKAGFWKCPYHNGRMCMELMERIRKEAL